MVVPLNIRGRSDEDLRAIAAVEITQLREFAQRISSLKMEIFSLRELRQLAEGLVSDDVARGLVRQVVGLANLARQRGISIDETVHALDSGVKLAKWKADELKKWTAVVPILREILSSDRITVLAKTLDLAHAYDNLLNSARIITDVRPVFDEPRSKIVGAIVAQTLRVDYTTEGGDRTVSLALDAHDVRTIREECDRALAKAQEAKKLMNEGCGIRTVVLHEEQNDDD